MRSALRAALAGGVLAGVALVPAVTAGAASAADGTPPATAGREHLRTETLADGTVVRIDRINALHHRAESFVNGRSIGVIDANTRPAARNDNGRFLVLHEDGTTHHWTGNLATGAEPGRYELADGTVLELGRKNGEYGLQLVENGTGRGFSYTNGEDRRVLRFGDALVVLGRDGGLAAYIAGGKKQAAPALIGTSTGPAGSTGGATPQGGTEEPARTSITQTTIVPKGGVAAGAEVQEGDNLMVVAGAGAAAVGAAGLGFVALRRRTSGTRA
ncbi:hypothetical protein [Streptomyces sp. NRRL S-118]|uniref:hypothetical protein n=1 Tax=Streptomyces sp. NRRL S-118 TaxID=1463881 RepID=UPI0004C6E415|nr:hypothetical protein [Streptomyces sp. NRRL S-118]